MKIGGRGHKKAGKGKGSLKTYSVVYIHEVWAFDEEGAWNRFQEVFERGDSNRDDATIMLVKADGEV